MPKVTQLKYVVLGFSPSYKMVVVKGELKHLFANLCPSSTSACPLWSENWTIEKSKIERTLFIVM